MSSSGWQVTSSPFSVIVSETLTSCGFFPSATTARQRSRSVTTPRSFLSSSAIGTIPTSSSRMILAGSIDVSWGEQYRGFGVITSLHFIIPSYINNGPHYDYYDYVL